ncbi:hypothetical protein CJU89_4851 [Yarrowia sp. B02]|nr:hypothetical protein CJU89_4851 [Yarrowia sp. B02]
MTITITYQETHLDLPYIPQDDIHVQAPTNRDTRQTEALTQEGCLEASLPSYEEVTHQQMALTVEFMPVVSVTFSKSARVKKMTTRLTRHIVKPGMAQTSEVVAQWDLFSGRVRPTEGAISNLDKPITIEPSTQEYNLACTLPARLPETVVHNTSRLWYTLDTFVSCQKWLISRGGITEYSGEIHVARSRQVNEQATLPVSASVPWSSKLRFSVSYPHRELALVDGAELSIRLSVTLFEKPIRLNSIKLSVSQTCNSEDEQLSWLFNVFSCRHLTSDQVEHDEMELNNAREQGFEVISNYLDSFYTGNLLIPGAEETVLDYDFKLSARVLDKLTASTSQSHPLHVVHKLVTSLRFSQLELTKESKQKMRRYFDVAVSTPLVLSRAKADAPQGPFGASASQESLEYDDFLLCEYPRLKNTVFENQFANDSAPCYESLMESSPLQSERKQ